MNVIPLVKGLNPVTERLKKKNLRTVNLEPTAENRKLLHDYNELTKEINDIPARIKGLPMTYRKRDIPFQVARLMQERELKMQKLIEFEKIIFGNP